MRWAIVQISSMAIDGPSMPIGKKCDGPIDGIEWSLSTGTIHNTVLIPTHLNKDEV